MNNEVRGSCLDCLPGVHTKQAYWCSFQYLCRAHAKEKPGGQDNETEGKGGDKFLGHYVGELFFLKALQLYLQNISAFVWVLYFWEQSAKA